MCTTPNTRKSPRADWIDYDGGVFFVTICTRNKYHFFGKIVDNHMQLSKIGEIVRQELEHPETHYPFIAIPVYVVMPNHIHAIIVINSLDKHTSDIALYQRNPNPSFRLNPSEARYVPLLSRYIGGFKSAVTKMSRRINSQFSWQSRYHDHMIRKTAELNKISDYIIHNPQNWTTDCFAKQ